jgi:pyridoxamine 5'-phosphate oxidase-like protein
VAVGRLYDEIDERNAAFIRHQRVFFVATAPLAGNGHVNLSPKGLESFAILGPREVAYLDLVGSCIETVAHVRENGRIAFLFCAFDGPPRILRLHGRAEVVVPGDRAWPELAARLPSHPSARAIVRARLSRIADSCGYGVPRLRFEAEREQLPEWAAGRGPEGLRAYADEHNRTSIDGLPGLGDPTEAG